MTLHLIYRSYGGENLKRRPSYYSKTLTLASFVRAAAAAPDAEILFLNDGPVPAGRLEIMERYGQVHQLAAQPRGMRFSYWATLEMAARTTWSDDDIVFFVEDDYLFTEDAFVVLDAAASQLTEASYFTLYGTRPDLNSSLDRVEHRLPYGWEPGPERTIDGRLWFNRASITSTFGARPGALRADLDIFRQCMRPFRRRYFDHETCLLYQGVVPYHGSQLLLGLPGDFIPGVRGVARAAVLVPFRVALNWRARRQPEPHRLYAVTPNLSTHLEDPVISPEQDWAAISVEVVDWAQQHHICLPVGNGARSDSA